MAVRTTVTLDADVLERLKQESRKRGVSFRQTLNDSLRKALLASSASPQKREFIITPRSTGVRAELNFDDVQGLLEHLDGPGHK